MSMVTTRRVPVGDMSSVSQVRYAARRLARASGFTSARVEQIVVCAVELATNLVKHTHGGAIYLQPAPGVPYAGLELLAVDDGPGTKAFENCIVDGYTTTQTLGTGLGAVRRMASRFAAYSLPSWGTAVFAAFHPERAPTARGSEHVDVGALCLPALGQEVSGDAYRIVADETSLAALVVDGLGHGGEAARASNRALAALRQPTGASPPDLLSAAHRQLFGTRGAAAAAIVVDQRRGRGEFCGVGNVAGVVLSGDTQRLGSRPGTLGLRVPLPYCQAFPLPSYGTLLLHTDGIRPSWDLGRYPGLLSQPAILLAAVLLRDFWRKRDDATIVVVRSRAATWHEAPGRQPGRGSAGG